MQTTSSQSQTNLVAQASSLHSDRETSMAPQESEASLAAVPLTVSLSTHLSYRDKSQEARLLEDYKDLAYTIPLGDMERPAVIMFADPDCPECMKAWRDLIPYLLSKKVHLQVALVGSKKSPYFYAEKDPILALLTHEISLMQGGQGATANGEVDPTFVGWVRKNEQLMEEYGYTRVPTFVTRDTQGRPAVFEGYSEVLTAVLGLN